MANENDKNDSPSESLADGDGATKNPRNEAIMHISDQLFSLQKIAEEHSIDFLAYVLKLAVIETKILLGQHS